MHDILCFETDSSEKDVRRRRVFDVTTEYVNAMQLQISGEEIDLRKGKDLFSWFLRTPVYDRADDKLINEFVKKLSKLDVDKYIEQPKEKIDLKYSVTLVQRENSQRLQISDEIVETNEYDEVSRYCYARRSEYGQFFTLPPDILKEFSGNADHYRAKTLFAPGVFEDLDNIIIEKDKERMELVFDKQLNKWDCTTMLSTTLKDELAIEDYAFLWLDLPIARFAESAEAKYAIEDTLSPLIIQIRFQGFDDYQEYNLSKDVDGLMFMERMSNVFVAVKTEDVMKLYTTNSFRFLTREALSVPEGEVDKIEISGKIGNINIDYGTNFWIATEKDASREIMPRMKDEIARRMPILIDHYVKECSELDLPGFGFQEPYMKLNFILKNGETKTISLGAKCGEGRYAMVGEQPYVFVLNKETVTALEQFPELARIYRE